jgi:serine/threonine protein kinase
LKYTKEYDMRNEKNADHIMNEALLLNQLSHPNIIKVVDYYNVRKYNGFSSVMEYSKCYT